jgi:hypothetical protein
VNLQTLFYKSHTDFAKEYGLSPEYILEILTDTRLGCDEPKATVLGMTEAELLKKLDLFTEVAEFSGEEDPRNQVYILSISS